MPEEAVTYTYRWKNNAKRASYFGRACKVIRRGGMNSALIEFLDNGERTVTSRNALRRRRP